VSTGFRCLCLSYWLFIILGRLSIYLPVVKVG